MIYYLSAIGESQVAVLESRHSHLWVDLGVPLIVVVHLDVDVHWHLVETEAELAQGGLDNLCVDASVGPIAVDFRTARSTGESCGSELRDRSISGLLYDSAQHLAFLVVLDLKFKLLIQDRRCHD